MTTESRADSGATLQPPNAADRSAALAQDVPAVTNEDPRTVTIRELIRSLEQTKSELGEIYKNPFNELAKGRGQNAEKIRLAKKQDNQYAGLLRVGLKAAQYPIPGIGFSITRDPASPEEKLLFSVSLGDESHSYTIPAVRRGRNQYVEVAVKNALRAADFQPVDWNELEETNDPEFLEEGPIPTALETYPWDPENVIEKGSDEERASLIMKTIGQLAWIEGQLPDRQFSAKIKQYEPLRDLKDQLVIGRLIYMKLLDRVPQRLGYNIAFDHAERAEVPPGLRVTLVVPQSEVGIEGINLHSYKARSEGRSRHPRIRTLLAMATASIHHSSGLPGTEQSQERP